MNNKTSYLDDLKDQLLAANKRIAELQSQVDGKVNSLMHNMVLRNQLADMTEKWEVSQGLLLATSAALDTMRQTAEIAARPAAVIIKRLAECEGEKYAVTQERDALRTWLKTAPLDAIVILSTVADGPYSDSSLARVAHVWASNEDMRRYVANLRKVVVTEVTE